jgi:hypothetical protein
VPAGVTLNREAHNSPGLFFGTRFRVFDNMPGQIVGVFGGSEFDLFKELSASLGFGEAPHLLK